MNARTGTRRYQDRQLIATARMVENLAEIVPEAQEHLAREMRLVDGHRDHTPGAGPVTLDPPARCEADITEEATGRVTVCGHRRPCAEHDPCRACGGVRPCTEHDEPVNLTPVERAASVRLDLERRSQSIEDRVKQVAVTVSDLLRDCHAAIGDRVAVQQPRCCEGQAGKDGSLEWGDPLCHDAPHKAGLCNRHYMAWYRHRAALGRSTADMFEPRM